MEFIKNLAFNLQEVKFDDLISSLSKNGPRAPPNQSELRKSTLDEDIAVPHLIS